MELPVTITLQRDAVIPAVDGIEYTAPHMDGVWATPSIFPLHVHAGDTLRATTDDAARVLGELQGILAGSATLPPDQRSRPVATTVDSAQPPGVELANGVQPHEPK